MNIEKQLIRSAVKFAYQKYFKVDGISEEVKVSVAKAISIHYASLNADDIIKLALTRYSENN